MTPTDIVTITLPSAECRGCDLVLRALEMTRQEWSTRWKGSPGMFAGYDTLNILTEDLSDDGWITFSAYEVRGGARSQLVELSATYGIADTSSAGDIVVAEGRGWNLIPEAETSPCAPLASWCAHSV